METSIAEYSKISKISLRPDSKEIISYVQMVYRMTG